MRTAFLLFGGLREYWWPTRVSDIKNKIIVPNNADVFMFFDKYSSHCNPHIKHDCFEYGIYTEDNEYESLQKLYHPHLKSLYLLQDPTNTNKNDTRTINSYLITQYIKTKSIQDFKVDFESNSIEESYHKQYENKIKLILSKFEPWLERLPMDQKITRTVHIGRITDLYLKILYCWKLMEEFENNNYFKFDRVIVGRIDMLYEDLDFSPNNDFVYLCRTDDPEHQMDCFYYGNRNLIEKICTNLIN